MTPVQRRERLCTACDRTVHDLSGRTDQEVRALLANGPACVRYLYDASGRRVNEVPRGATLVPARSLFARADRRRWLRAAALATSAIVFEACGGNDGMRHGDVPRLDYPAPVDEPDAGTDAGDAGAPDR